MTLIGLLMSAKRAIGAWHGRQKAYAELSALDDRCLTDIGIHRSEIPGIVYRAQQKQRPAKTPSVADVPGFGTRTARLAGAHRWFPPF